MEEVKVKVINKSENPLPHYATEGSAGMDLYADIHTPVILHAGSHMVVPTGIYMAIPEGFELQIRPRSGLAAKNGITVLNTPGTIDSDYRGEIGVILANLSDKDFVITRDMRIAQAVLTRYSRIVFEKVSNLDTTERGGGGFGHTGI